MDAQIGTGVAFCEAMKSGQRPYLKGMAVAPAIVDQMPLAQFSEITDLVKLTEGETETEVTAYHAMAKFIDTVIEAASKGELMVDLSESAESRFTAEQLPGAGGELTAKNRDSSIKAEMVSVLGSQEKYDEAKAGNFEQFSAAREKAFINLGINDFYNDGE